MRAGVYAIKHVATGRLYIGSSVRITDRFAQHRRLLRVGRHHAAHLQRAWAKYGEDAFEFAILEECERDKTRILQREQHYIDTLHPVFNYAKHAGSRLGVPVSAATRAQISATLLALPKPRRIKTHCIRGHPLSGENVYRYPTARGGEGRACRACRALAYRARNPERGPDNATKTHCKHGHPLSGDNLIATARQRTCKVCRLRNARAYNARKRAAH